MGIQRLTNKAKIPLSGRQAGNVLSILRDASGGLGIESGNRTEQGRLAASRRTKKADELSSVDFQRKFPNRNKLPKMLGEVLNS